MLRARPPRLPRLPGRAGRGRGIPTDEMTLAADLYSGLQAREALQGCALGRTGAPGTGGMTPQGRQRCHRPSAVFMRVALFAW